MRWIRPRLVRVAAGWLVFQLALLIAMPTAICSTMPTNSVAADCSCDHGDAQICAMHHTRPKSQSASDSHSCSCQSTTDPLPAALSGPPAVLVADASALPALDAIAEVATVASQPRSWMSVPDLPPPRF